jgi:hypothetical protein
MLNQVETLSPVKSCTRVACNVNWLGWAKVEPVLWAIEYDKDGRRRKQERTDEIDGPNQKRFSLYY